MLTRVSDYKVCMLRYMILYNGKKSVFMMFCTVKKPFCNHTEISLTAFSLVRASFA